MKILTRAPETSGSGLRTT